MSKQDLPFAVLLYGTCTALLILLALAVSAGDMITYV
jgi:hypothetical protein